VFGVERGGRRKLAMSELLSEHARGYLSEVMDSESLHIFGQFIL